MAIENIWWYFTEKFSSLIIHPQFFLKKYSNDSIKLALPYAKGTLLDIGCGRMPYKKLFLPKVTKYIGLDHPKVSKKYKGGDKPDILADATKIPLPNGTADIVLMFSVIEHLPEPLKALKEAVRVLKKGGVLILTTDQNYPLHDIPYDFYRFSRFSLAEFVKQTGLKKIKQITYGCFLVLINQTINVFLLYTIKDLLKRGVGKKIIGILLIPPVILFTSISNCLIYILSYFFNEGDNSSFGQCLTLIAKKVR